MSNPCIKLHCLTCHKAGETQQISVHVVDEEEWLLVICNNHDPELQIFDMPVRPDITARLRSFNARQKRQTPDGSTIH